MQLLFAHIDAISPRDAAIAVVPIQASRVPQTSEVYAKPSAHTQQNLPQSEGYYRSSIEKSCLERRSSGFPRCLERSIECYGRDKIDVSLKRGVSYAMMTAGMNCG
jgi:hypothetical protein